MNRVIFFALMLEVLSFCNPDHESKVVVFYHYQIEISNLDRRYLMDSMVLYLDSIIHNNRVDYSFKISQKSDTSYGPDFSIEGDSLFYSGVYCKVLDTVYLKYDNRTIELYESDYDEQNSFDEESIIFWNHRYGLIGAYNYAMGPLLLIDHPSIPRFAKTELYDYVIEKERKTKADWIQNSKSITQ